MPECPVETGASSIIENYQGRFAKVIEVKDSLVGVSAFVLKRENAEEETAVDIFLNEFGLAQIVKEEKKAPTEKKAKKEEKKDAE